MAKTPHYVSCSIAEFLVGELLPVPVFIYLERRFLAFRAPNMTIDRTTQELLLRKKIIDLFVLEGDLPNFREWTRKWQIGTEIPVAPEMAGVARSRDDMKRKALDIFTGNNLEKGVTESFESSKRMVAELMKLPVAVKNLGQLQGFSKDAIDHSLNVSILSTYLAMQMGYSHQIILKNLGVGGLLHDIGKPHVVIPDNADAAVVEEKLREHPTKGPELLNDEQKVGREVRMVVEQHHEYYDGSGFPQGLRGTNIYDLARIVCIANIFDELVAQGSGTLIERQRMALKQMDEVHYRKFDPQKLEKALKILKNGV